MGSEFGLTADTKPELRLNAVGVFWIVFAVIWTVVLLSGMSFLHVRRNMPILRVRGLPLSLASVSLLHLYWFAVTTGYVYGPLMPEVVGYWIMGVWFPLGIALFHASNSRFLYVANAQKRYVSSANSTAWDRNRPRIRKTLVARWRMLDYSYKMVLLVGLGMSLQVAVCLVAVILGLDCRSRHPLARASSPRYTGLAGSDDRLLSVGASRVAHVAGGPVCAGHGHHQLLHPSAVDCRVHHDDRNLHHLHLLLGGAQAVVAVPGDARFHRPMGVAAKFIGPLRQVADLGSRLVDRAPRQGRVHQQLRQRQHPDHGRARAHAGQEFGAAPALLGPARLFRREHRLLDACTRMARHIPHPRPRRLALGRGRRGHDKSRKGKGRPVDGLVDLGYRRRPAGAAIARVIRVRLRHLHGLYQQQQRRVPGQPFVARLQEPIGRLQADCSRYPRRQLQPGPGHVF